MYFENFDLVGKTLFQAGLNSSHSGNISIFDRKQNIVYIKRSGAMLHALKENDIIKVYLDSMLNYELASSELPAHIAIYKNTNANAIVHCHPINAVALSLMNAYTFIPLKDVESIYHLKKVPITVEAWYGESLAKNIFAYFNNALYNTSINTVVVRGHGSFSIGETLEECLHYATTLEQACKIFVAMNNLK